MDVLVVGCGYVGLPLGKELVRQGHQVFGLRRTSGASLELEASGITPIHADITRPETLSGLPRDFDWVVNCAASGGGGVDDYRNLYLEGNRNLVAHLKGNPPRKFVYTGSTSVYAQNDGSLVTEESPTQPAAETAKVLVETERLLLGAAETGFPAVILRVAGIYGPGRGYALKQFLGGAARIEGDGTRVMNMIHRDDLVGIIIAALNHGKAGRIYNAADNLPVAQKDFYAWLAGQLKKPMPATIPAEAEAWLKRGVTNKRVSNARLRAELKYDFKFPDFRAGYATEVAVSPTGHFPV